MSETDLGPQPDPEIEPGEPNPGGVDAVPVDRENIPADLTVEANPAVETESAPDAISEGEDTSTEATRGDGEGEGNAEGEATA
ncbi:hypothetical protein [Nocardioides pantholopis]|uniref:hypothetical protein n=1 Tax=Nocardioides pantholopis TaxID=2483798 RepID=UPI000F085283|nr:hypothetical protein [Nocardioides pantholopis]